MSAFHDNALIGSSAPTGYNLTNSLRFRASANPFLSRTPASAGNQKTWTWSAWIKRGSLTTPQWLFAGGAVSTDYTFIRFGTGGNNNDSLEYARVVGSTLDAAKHTSMVFRDTSAWYHIVVVEDAANSIARIYVNGTEAAYSTNDNPSNVNGAINAAAIHNMGRYTGSNIQHFDGYMDEVNFIDGQALTPASFGAINPSTGVWQPKKYTGSYGTNGFYLPFTDNSALTTSSNVGLGRDYSGNGNFWATNNISITAGTTYYSMTDVPTLTSATTSNYCVLNPLNTGIAPIWGNLVISQSAGSWVSSGSTFVQSTGKYYFESFMGTIGAGNYIGVGLKIAGSIGVEYVGQVANSWGIITNSASLVTYTGNTASNATVISATTAMAFQVAVDYDAGKIWLGYNNTWLGGGNPSAGTSPTYTFTANTPLQPILSAFAQTSYINFGQQPFSYTPPTGFNRLNTFNLPTPTIGASASTLANKNFDATLWTGNGATQTIVNSGAMQPDLVWIKNRSAAQNHIATDSVRGNTAQLRPSSTDAESTSTIGITSFNSNGFSIGNQFGINDNTNAFVGWQWRANGAAVTNTAGTQTSQVSANTSAGFSVVTFTTPSSGNFTVGHGLGVAPSMYIIKRRGNTSGWGVWHKNLAGGTSYLTLESTNAQATDATVFSASPTSTVLNIGSAWTVTGAVTSVAYCFSEVAGYSAFGSYTGTGSADGTFVFTGFRPRFLLIKMSSSTGDWRIYDTSRSLFNVSNTVVFPNLADAEASTSLVDMDILSNGFKLRNSLSTLNASSGTYIYMAFAENPFKYSLAR